MIGLRITDRISNIMIWMCYDKGEEAQLHQKKRIIANADGPFEISEKNMQTELPRLTTARQRKRKIWWKIGWEREQIEWLDGVPKSMYRVNVGAQN